MRPTLPAVASAWARRSLGAEGEPLAARLLPGGWTSHTWSLRFAGVGDHVLKRMVREPWRTHAAELLGREHGVLQLLHRSELPVARPVALDLTGADAGVPSLLMTRLPGALRLDDAGEATLDRLAGLLVSVHALRVTPAERPRPYYSWAYPERQAVPRWAADPPSWERAFELLGAEPPAHRAVFMHRDFHPGNVLWEGDAVSGVVDWVETSWGPAELDVAHCQTALSILHGVDAALAFAAAYARRGGLLGAPERLRHWQVMDAVGFLPDPAKVARPWRQAGRVDLSDALARRRLERWLGVVLAGR